MATIAQTATRPRRSTLARREAVEGLLYISPFLLGFLIFTAYPMIASLYLSFTKYNIITAPTWIGLENYQEAFFQDAQFWASLWRTLYFALRFASEAGSLPADTAPRRPPPERRRAR